MKTRIALASGLALALAASSISAIAVPNSQEKNAPKVEQAQFQLPGTMIQIKPNDLTKTELKELVRKVDKAVSEQTAKAKLNSSENYKDRAANSENNAPGNNSTAGTTDLRRAVPDPNPALDFKNIKEDPENYRLPKAAEAFKSGNKYQIPTPTQGGKAVGEYDQALLKYYAQKVTWGSCEPFGYGSEKKIQCAYAIVPMDYTKPNGPTIAVGMLKVLSQAGDKKLGTVFTDPGGPGGSGMNLAYGQIGDPITEKFDIIGFDPRGVGSSLPQIRCESSDAKDKQRQYSDAISGEEADKILEYNTNKCYENTGKVFTGLSGKEFIGTVGTANVVRDLDVMRSIVGDSKLSYLGFSYGTSIGYRYAQLFPSHIRALILDGQVNPYENNPELLKKYEGLKILASSTESSDVSQMRGFNDTFKQFLKACLKGTVNGADCPLRDGAPIADPTEEQVQKAYDNYLKLARAAWDTGYYTSKDKRDVSFADVTQGTILTMYSDSLWKYLKTALTLMKNNKDASIMMLLADSYYERDKDTGKYDFSDASFRSISCTDIKDASDNRDEQLEISKDLFKTAPFLDPGTDENGKQRGLKAAYGWCHYYKVREQLPKGEEIKDVPNVLVISSSYDPATPYENGVVAAMGLHGTLLSVANNSHCAYGKVGCASAVSLAYLTDPLKFIADVNRDKYDKGQSNVQTRHIYSDKDVNGNECQIDYYGPKLQSIENGKEVTEVNQVFNQATLKASGFLPGKEVKFVSSNGTVLGKATADEKGNAELSLTKLATLPAGKEVQILAQSSNMTAVLALKVNPRQVNGVIKDKAGVKVITRTKAGSEITIEGHNFIPNEKVEFVLHSNPVPLGTATADAKGNVVLKAKVPADTKLGNHQVWLVQGKTTLKLPLEVFSDTPTKPGKITDDLSSTGTSATIWLLLSGLLSAGGFLLVYRRKALV